MSRYDLIRIAFKTLKGRWAAIPVALVVVSMFCLCYAGAVFTTVDGEKSKPYEVNMSAGSLKLTDDILAKASKLDGVSAVTPVIDVPVKISVGEYSAQLTLEGVKASYLKGGFDEGGIFQDSSIMPYIVLNKAACKQFSKAEDTDMTGDISDMDSDDGDTATATATPSIGWLKTQAVIVSDKENIPAKICGILSGDDKSTMPDNKGIMPEGNKDAAPADNKDAAPADNKDAMPADNDDTKPVNGNDTMSADDGDAMGYISLSSAKQLLAQSGGSSDYTGAKARVKNMGFAEDVSTSIKALGLSVENTNEDLQSKWDRESDEAVFLTVAGAIGLLCFVLLIIALKKISMLEYKESWSSFKWAGFRDRDINNVFLFRSLIISIAGVVIGLIIALSLPSFLPSKLQEKSIMMLNVPFVAAAISAAICIAAGLLPSINRKGKV